MDGIGIPQYEHTRCLSFFRPNMCREAKQNVIRVMESGLLFKEDAVFIEEKLLLVSQFPHNSIGVETLVATISVVACFITVPIRMPIQSGGNLLRLCGYVGAACIPFTLRLFVQTSLPSLLSTISHYTLMVRRHIASKIWNPIESVSALLLFQQKYMCRVVRQAKLSLLEAFPWLEDSQEVIDWEESDQVKSVFDGDDLTKIHHLVLVLQSTFLKNIALAHGSNPEGIRGDYNDRVHWMHVTLIPAVLYHFEYCSAVLESAYKSYKEMILNRDSRLLLPRLIQDNKDPWQYLEVHTGVTAIGTDLRMALVKCNEMDSLLEACRIAKSKFSPEIFQADLENVRDGLLKSFASIERTFVQLKKIRSAEMKLLEAAVQKLPLPSVEEEDCSGITVSEDTPLQIQDQVFYYEKSKETDCIDQDKIADYTTGPGKNEIDTTKVVLSELKVKLVKREEEMREREARALENTMPELKGKLPEFPRQINLEKKSEVDEQIDDRRILKFYNNASQSKVKYQDDGKVIANGIKEQTARESTSETQLNNAYEESTIMFTGECSSAKENEIKESEDQVENVNGIHKTNNRKVSERSRNVDFLSDEYFGSSTDTETDQEPSSSLLKDVRKHRVTRKKKYPPSRSESLKSKEPNAPNGSNADDTMDEGLKPVEYSFGTGLAVASLFQIPPGREGKINLLLLGEEETFDGEGEVSDDSGNED